MRAKNIILFILTFLLTVLFVTKINFQPNFVELDINEIFYFGYLPTTADPKNYDFLVENEDKNGYSFPRHEPKKVILFSNFNYWKSEYILTNEQSEKLLKILNDSNSYRWGELGTPEVHYYLKYYNDKNELIGFTKIDQEGMAYSEPYLTKMKWCGLKNIDEINKLISEIEK